MVFAIEEDENTSIVSRLSRSQFDRAFEFAIFEQFGCRDPKWFDDIDPAGTIEPLSNASQ